LEAVNPAGQAKGEFLDGRSTATIAAGANKEEDAKAVNIFSISSFENS
jgi:hypothetical protein